MMKRIGLAAWLMLAMAPAAWAQVAAEHPGSTGGGMPQLNFSHPLVVAQVVWLLLIFGLLYYTMAKVALPRVAEVLEQRRQRIDGDLEAAQAAKQRADVALEEHRAATAKARGEAQAAINAAVQQAQVAAAGQAEVMTARLNAQIGEAEARIAAARDSAMGALRQVAAETAEALVNRLIGPGNGAGQSDRAQVDRAVDRHLSLRDMPAGGRA